MSGMLLAGPPPAPSPIFTGGHARQLWVSLNKCVRGWERGGGVKKRKYLHERERGERVNVCMREICLSDFSSRFRLYSGGPRPWMKGGKQMTCKQLQVTTIFVEFLSIFCSQSSCKKSKNQCQHSVHRDVSWRKSCAGKGLDLGRTRWRRGVKGRGGRVRESSRLLQKHSSCSMAQRRHQRLPPGLQGSRGPLVR